MIELSKTIGEQASYRNLGCKDETTATVKSVRTRYKIDGAAQDFLVMDNGDVVDPAACYFDSPIA